MSGETGDQPTTPRKDRLAYIEAATNTLAAAVEALTTVVKQNTAVVELLRAEVNQKPDDSELQAIAGFAATERANYMRRLATVGLAGVLMSGGSSYYFAKLHSDTLIHERNIVFNASCVKNNKVLDSLISEASTLSKGETLNETPGIGKTREARIQAYDRLAVSLGPLKKDCNQLYPIK